MFAWILDALEVMDRSRADSPELDSLMSEGHKLELFVTMADFHGYLCRIPMHYPGRVSDLRHRHAMKFSYISRSINQFDASHNPVLTFAARATSSFPGAFSPINIANIANNLGIGWPGQENIERDFFGQYQLSDCNVQNTHFDDGGVLDNFPFGLAINSKIEKPASLQVDRQLIYIQPDPATRSSNQIQQPDPATRSRKKSPATRWETTQLDKYYLGGAQQHPLPRADS